MKLSWLFPVVAVALTGCDSCNKSVPEAPAEASAPLASTARAPLGAREAGAQVPWAAIPSATAPILPNMGIADRFQTEERARPKDIKPNVESVYAALEKAGFTIADKKQHLAQTFGARYCVGARAVKGDVTQLQLSVCEFVSNEVAKMSQSYSAEALNQIPNRVIHAKAQTTLTVREEADTPENKSASDKALAAYDAL